MPAGKFYLATKGTAHRAHAVSLSHYRSNRSNKSYNRSYNKSKSDKKTRKICQEVIDSNTEFKRYVRDLPATALSNITNGQILFQGPPIPQGDDAISRDGNEVKLRKIKFKMLVKSVGASNRVRLILVKYPQPPATLDLSTVLINVTAQNVMISPWVKNGEFRYQILYNRIHNLGTKTVMDGTYKYQDITIECRFKKSGETLHYKDAVTANPDKNAFVLYAVSDQALASPNTNELSMYTECVYTDV